jgi:hypothetical protein
LGVNGTIGSTYTITYTASGLTVATATVTLTGTTCDGKTFTCQVGDTGPGGGKIFYVASGVFTQVGATGSMCSTSCKYLEAAPTTGVNAWANATYAWSGNTTDAIGVNAQGILIGTGYKNTLAIVNQSSTGDKAGTISRAYGGPNSLSDWYLPSQNELSQLFSQKDIVGGVVGNRYWSSSEYVASDALYAWTQRISDGSQNFNSKNYSLWVRPVRAFGPDAAISVATIAGVTAPVAGATPVSTTTAGTGYAGTVTWASSGGALSGNFAAATAYTATITLTPTPGYTLTGVSANFFTVAGATPVTNSADSGVIRAVFPATAGPAAKVAITRASVGSVRGTAFTTQPQITIQDSGSNTVTSSTALVTATVSTGGTLVGISTATASAGVATFTGLGVNGTIGSTYTITYTASGLTVATATVILTCNGITFTCKVGDTGPGGGKIFYVAPANTPFACGPTLAEFCRYLEAAPTTGANAWIDAPYAWSGTTARIGVNAQGTAIGTGYANTLAIVNQSNTAERAGTISRAYGGPNNLSDWYLPSKDELNEFYKERNNVGAALSSSYWSSSEVITYGQNAWEQFFFNSNPYGAAKDTSSYVRPVRAF